MESHETAFLSFFQPGANREEAALAYASLGMHVFPLTVHGKEPFRGSRAVHDATTSTDQIKQWWSEHPFANIGIGLRRSCVVIIDIDPRNGGDETLEKYEARYGTLPQTYSVATANDGEHHYYRVSPDFYETLADQLPKKLGPGVDLLVNGYAVAPPSELDGNKHYRAITGAPNQNFARAPVSWIQQISIEAGVEQDRARWAEDENWSFGIGERNNGMARIAGYFRRVGFTAQEIFYILKVIGPTRFEDFAEISDKEIWQTAKSIANNPPSSVRLDSVTLRIKNRKKEPVLQEAALHGPIGDWIRHIEPITEANNASLLMQALVYFGNMIGARKHSDIAPGFSVEGAYHRTALYCLVIGESAKAGKGDSWRRVRELMGYVDPKLRPLTGLQTGEGVLDYLADDELLDEHTKINGERVQHKKKGSGNDRRCLLYEPEFGRLLHVSERRGSVIKDVLRDLWDTGESGKITAASKQFISEATVSLVGHITKPELERDYDQTDFLTGFGNRFTYCYARRSKHLLSDEARALTHIELEQLGEPLIEALKFAQRHAPDEITFTDAAADLWDFEIDEQLMKESSVGEIINSLTSRGRPIVRRLATIYAVADCSDVITTKHLRAAFAAWQYCVETAEFAFTDHIGDRDADKLYRSLAENRAGLTLTEIGVGVYKNKKSAAQIKRSIKILVDRGLVVHRKEKKGTRTTEVFFLKPEV